MMLSVDKIVAKFPIKILPIITGKPDYESINHMVQTLYSNAASLATPLSSKAHGHIGIIMRQALYSTLTATPYTSPPYPGELPYIPLAATAPIWEVIRLQHTEERHVYDNHVNMDDALKSQVINAIHKTYICEMRNKYTGYLGVTTRDLLDHLLDWYGKITPANIETCKCRMIEPINSTQPIKLFFNVSMTACSMPMMGKWLSLPNKIFRQRITQ